MWNCNYEGRIRKHEKMDPESPTHKEKCMEKCREITFKEIILAISPEHKMKIFRFGITSDHWVKKHNDQ